MMSRGFAVTLSACALNYGICISGYCCETGWAIIDLGPVPVSSPSAGARLSNTGYSVAENHLWLCSEFVDFVPPDGESVNDFGFVAGHTLVSGIGYFGYFWDGKTTTFIGTTNPGNTGSSYAYGINNQNVVVGESNGIAFVWQSGKLTPLPGNGVSYALDISDTGYIAGFTDNIACRWHDGKIDWSDTLPGGELSKAFAVNDSGAVVGYSDHGSTYKAFQFANDVLTELPALHGNAFNYAMSINNAGIAVGGSTDGGPFSYFAVLWENGKVIDLQERVYPPLRIDLDGALDINDQGWIIGRTVNGHMFLMRPAHSSDVNCDGHVDVNDLLLVVNTWGKCSGTCPTDVDNNGQVNVDDLLAVINAWSACP